MIDVAVLVQQTVSALAPALPYLVDAGRGAAKKVGEAAAGTAFEGARKLWKWLRPTAATHRPEVLEAAEDVAKDINNPDTHAAFRQQLRKMLESNPDLQEQLQKVVQLAVVHHNIVDVRGAGAVGVGASVSGTTITTNVNRPA